MVIQFPPVPDSITALFVNTAHIAKSVPLNVVNYIHNKTHPVLIFTRA